jgi:hypothetical protein
MDPNASRQRHSKLWLFRSAHGNSISFRLFPLETTRSHSQIPEIFSQENSTPNSSNPKTVSGLSKRSSTTAPRGVMHLRERVNFGEKRVKDRPQVERSAVTTELIRYVIQILSWRQPLLILPPSLMQESLASSGAKPVAKAKHKQNGIGTFQPPQTSSAPPTNWSPPNGKPVLRPKKVW